MKYEFPDYDNCCVNIISSVSKYFGLNPYHSTLPLVDKELKKGYKNVVVLLLDGMGQDMLARQLPQDSFLRTYFLQELSAVFPSSTTPSTVSFKSGLTPLEHGWWGHYLYLKEVGCSTNLYLNTETCSKKNVHMRNVAHNVMPYETILDQIDKITPPSTHCYAICNEEARDEAGITQITYATFDEMSDYIYTLTQNPGGRYIYAYHNFPDDMMHKKGPYSNEVGNLMAELDAQVEYLCKRCSDTLFLISADHGQTEIHEVRDIADYPDVCDCMIMPPTGLSRCFNFYIKADKRQEFVKLAKKYFSDKFLLFSKKEVLEKGLLGKGKQHYKIDDTLSDYLLVAIDDCNLAMTTLYELPIIQPIGNHGGLTVQEMRVPLIMYGEKIHKK